MSRIGKRPISIPSGVTITPKDGGVEVKGPRGTLFDKVLPTVGLQVEAGSVVLTRADESHETRAAHGLARSLLQNMVTGVTVGFRKQLEIVGVGYKAEVQGAELVLSLGYSHPIRMRIPKGMTVKAERPTALTIEGADRQAVGKFAAEIRSTRKPEPYKGKGVKYVDERVRRKVGKTGATVGTK
jgi:large subunit ribosomal protein L6